MIDYGISQQQLAVICALSSGATTTAAAADVGVHRNTIAGWRRNDLAFQQAFAHAQYDRALYFREKIEAEVDLAIQTLHALLADPKTPASIRLKAALAVLNTASTPPEPKKQVILDIEKIVLKRTQPEPEFGPEVHNSAQSAPPPDLHNTAQVPYRRETPKIGRNEICPCGSGKKFKRCCLERAA